MGFNSSVLVPIAVVGIVVAIVLLVLRRKKNGVRPPHAKAYLIVAILLFVYAAIVMIILPLIYLVTLLMEFGVEFFYAALKSLSPVTVLP